MFDIIRLPNELYPTENEKNILINNSLWINSIKQAITTYSKIQLFNIDPQNKLKNEGYFNFYDNNSIIFQNQELGIQKLSKCLIECEEQTKNLKQFL